MRFDEVYQAVKPYFKRRIEEVSEEDIKKVLEISYNAEMPKLFAAPYFGEEEIVSYDTNEIIGKCPWTTLLDYYRAIITYVPDKHVCELKSLKFYYLAYEQLPITHELLLSKIYKEFQEQIKPKQLKVVLEVAVRGGIKTIVEKGKVEVENLNLYKETK